jgi:hypothetical protein
MSTAGPGLVIEIGASSGAVLARSPASLAALVEDATFRGVLTGRFANGAVTPEFEIEPRSGSTAAGVESVALSCGGAVVGTYPRAAFAAQAGAVVARLRAARRLAPDAEVVWRLRPCVTRAPSLRRVRSRRSPYPLRDARLAHGAPGSLELAIAAHVLDDLREASRAGAGVERAWLLLGRLLHDPRHGAARLEISDRAELSAGRGGASSVHFAFDARSFQGALDAARRRTDLVSCGWAHDHPPCAACAEQPSCRNETIFFSQDDHQVHSSAFGRAYQVALVAGKLRDRPATQPGFRIYGWHGGTIAERPFLVVPDELDEEEA